MPQVFALAQVRIQLIRKQHSAIVCCSVFVRASMGRIVDFSLGFLVQLLVEIWKYVFIFFSFSSFLFLIKSEDFFSNFFFLSNLAEPTY